MLSRALFFLSLAFPALCCPDRTFALYALGSMNGSLTYTIYEPVISQTGQKDIFTFADCTNGASGPGCSWFDQAATSFDGFTVDHPSSAYQAYAATPADVVVSGGACQGQHMFCSSQAYPVVNISASTDAKSVYWFGMTLCNETAAPQLPAMPNNTPTGKDPNQRANNPPRRATRGLQERDELQASTMLDALKTLQAQAAQGALDLREDGAVALGGVNKKRDVESVKRAGVEWAA